jgi:hypothetical protein
VEIEGKAVHSDIAVLLVQPKAKRRVRRILIPVFLLLTSIALWHLAVRWQRPASQEVSGPGDLTHAQSTGNVAFTLMPGAYHSYEFSVPPNHLDVTLQGTFSSAGNGDDSIQVYVFSEDDYISWKNGYNVFKFYDSGEVNRGSFSIPLRSWSADRYHVVFNGKSSPHGPKAVKANLSLIYNTRWWAEIGL